jgi:hypothetical protein
VSGGHAGGGEHTPVGSVALIISPGDGFLPGVGYYRALLTSALAARRPVAMVPRCDPAAPAEGIRTALPLMRTAHTDPHSWTRSAERYAALLDWIEAGWSQGGRIPGDQAKEVVA